MQQSYISNIFHETEYDLSSQHVSSDRVKCLCGHYPIKYKNSILIYSKCEIDCSLSFITLLNYYLGCRDGRLRMTFHEFIYYIHGIR